MIYYDISVDFIGFYSIIILSGLLWILTVLLTGSVFNLVKINH